jgi:hypothetical protein
LNLYSYEKAFLSLRQYVAAHMAPQDEHASGTDTLYHFGDNNHTEWDELFRRYRLPPFIPADAETALSWGERSSYPLMNSKATANRYYK